ncbi:MAG: polysaccharide biosynthesis protein, partial [Anaerolineales bacterium]
MKPLVQIRNRYLLLIDLILIVTGVLASFALRLDLGPAFSYYLPSALKMIAVAVIIKPIVYFLFGLYRRYWVYASIRELRLIFFATVAASVWVSVVVLFIRSLGGFFEGFPRSVLGIDWLLSLFSVGGLRVIIRVLAETGQISQKSSSPGSARRLIIAGAGAAGVLVVRELQRNPQMNVRPVGFVDDDPEKLGKEIHGINVLGQLDEVGEVVEKEQADEVVIAIPTAPGQVIRLVTDQCRQKGIPFRTMPGMYELIGGQVSVNRLREVAIDDLLRREPAVIDDEAVGRTLSSKRILVTGAGGSIGTELCRQIARWMPSQL